MSELKENPDNVTLFEKVFGTPLITGNRYDESSKPLEINTKDFKEQETTLTETEATKVTAGGVRSVPVQLVVVEIQGRYGLQWQGLYVDGFLKLEGFAVTLGQIVETLGAHEAFHFTQPVEGDPEYYYTRIVDQEGRVLP